MGLCIRLFLRVLEIINVFVYLNIIWERKCVFTKQLNGNLKWNLVEYVLGVVYIWLSLRNEWLNMGNWENCGDLGLKSDVEGLMEERSEELGGGIYKEMCQSSRERLMLVQDVCWEEVG